MKVELRRVGGFYSFYSFFTVFFFHSFDFVYYFFSINIRVTHVRFGRSRLRLKKSTNKKKTLCWCLEFFIHAYLAYLQGAWQPHNGFNEVLWIRYSI